MVARYIKKNIIKTMAYSGPIYLETHNKIDG